MTEHSLRRINASYDLLAARMPALAESFYARLFRAAPETRGLFKIDIPLQSQHLAAALSLIVRNLRMLDVLEEALMDLGAGHALVGVRPEHYPIVNQMMLETLRDGAGPAWSEELESDWRSLLELVSRIMMDGAIRKAASARTP